MTWPSGLSPDGLFFRSFQGHAECAVRLLPATIVFRVGSECLASDVHDNVSKENELPKKLSANS
jgi:hypothetical protein